MTNILLSFTATLDEIGSGALTEEDLRTAIFCFGCDAKWPFSSAEIIQKEQKPFQKRDITATTIKIVQEHLSAAQNDGRVVWRWGNDPVKTQVALSKVLARRELEALNPNLPPCDKNDFLKTAIERVNNKDGLCRVRVITT